jgi:hypothetical protein
MWKIDLQSLFFFGVLLDPLPPTFLILVVYVFSTLMFSVMIWVILYISNLSAVLCGIRFAARACPVPWHELVIHSCDVKL